jgi:AcrR family transcriptional regulator
VLTTRTNEKDQNLVNVDPLRRFLALDYAESADLRNSPQQERSRLSLENILRVCGEIIDETGHAGVTTAEVAKRAEMAIGTVYRFFPDRVALMLGVYDYMIKRYVEMCIEALEAAEPTSWKQTFEILTDTNVIARRTVPGYRATQYRVLADEESQEKYNLRSTSYIDAVVGQLAQFGLPDDAEWNARVAVAIELSRALQRLAFDAEPDGDEWLLDEARNVAITYLETQLAAR